MLIRARRFRHIVFVWLVFTCHALAADDRAVLPLAVGEHTAQLNGVKLWYKVAGNGPVCLMPSPAQGYSSVVYVRTLGCMEKLFTMVYIDSRGTGQSGRAQALNQYTWDHLVGDLEALRDHLHQQTIWLMGHSSAGYTVLHYALKHPNRVSGLVLLDTAAFYNWKVRVADENMRLARWKGNPLYDGALKAWYARWRMHSKLEDSELLKIGDEENSKNDEACLALYWSDPKKIQQFDYAFKDDKCTIEGTVGERASKRGAFDLRGELRKVTAPALIVCGDDDFICSPECAVTLHLGLPNSKLLLIEGSGHYPWLEQPKVFETRVPEFLAALGLTVR